MSTTTASNSTASNSTATTTPTATNQAPDLAAELQRLRAENERLREGEMKTIAELVAANSERLAKLPAPLAALIDRDGEPRKVREMIDKAEAAAKPLPIVPGPRGNQLAAGESWRTGRHWENPAHPASDESLIRQGRAWALGRRQGLPY